MLDINHRTNKLITYKLNDMLLSYNSARFQLIDVVMVFVTLSNLDFFSKTSLRFPITVNTSV